MTPCAFHRPSSLAEAASLLAKHPGARVLAGGTDFLVKWRNGLWPDLAHIIDLSRLGLREIHIQAEKIIIGSGCTMSQIAAHPKLQALYPALIQAVNTVGAPQIRNAATLGGNVANASPAGDSLPALYTLEVEVVLRAPNAVRQIPIQDLLTGPGRTSCHMGEIIEAFIVPLRKTRGAFLKLGERRAHAIAKVSVAVSAWEDRLGRHARIACGAVGPTVLRVPEAESILAEAPWPPDAGVCARAGAAVERAVKPIDDLRSVSGYRRQMAGVLSRRALSRIFHTED